VPTDLPEMTIASYNVDALMLDLPHQLIRSNLKPKSRQINANVVAPCFDIW
jgi:hypothetical protein